jgi:hypothetical protein
MTFAQLTKKIQEVSLGTARMTDIKDGIYHLECAGDKVTLVSETGHKVPVNTNNFAALASMRIVEDEKAAQKIATTADARISPVYSNLKDKLAKEGAELDESFKFNVVHRLKIKDVATDTLVYQNVHYNGYPEYVKAARKANALPNITPAEQTARQQAFADASENLRNSGIKEEVKESSENLVLMPVFTMTTK